MARLQKEPQSPKPINNEVRLLELQRIRQQAKEDALKDIVRMYFPEILLIQETKMEETPLLNASKSFWCKGIGSVVSARGTSGGIATF